MIGNVDKTGRWNRDFIAKGFYLGRRSMLWEISELTERHQLILLDSINDVELAIVKMMQPKPNLACKRQ